MRLFLSILEGPTPAEARPLVATSDPVVLRAVIAALMERLILPLPMKTSDRRQRSKSASRA